MEEYYYDTQNMLVECKFIFADTHTKSETNTYKYNDHFSLDQGRPFLDQYSNSPNLKVRSFLKTDQMILSLTFTVSGIFRSVGASFTVHCL